MKHLVLPVAVLATILACTANVRAQGPGSQESSEYLIKAGYIYNFAKLVEWPSSAARKGQPMVIGVLGNDAFATVLERVVQGKTIDERPLVVKRLRTRDFKDCSCQILFLAAAQSTRTDDVVQFQNASSVLTVAEAPEFAKRGGIIAMTLEDSKVRFAVNVDAATQASLNISSRLLALASIVHSTR
jgi:hypothetical protein